MTYESHAGQAGEPQPHHLRKRVPGKVKWVIGLLCFQAVANALGGVLLFVEAQSRADHGQDGVGLLRVSAAVSVLLVALLAVCAVAAMRGAEPWSWSLTVALEVVAVAGGLFTVVTGGGSAAIGIAIAFVVLSLLRDPGSQEWYGRGRRSTRGGSTVDPSGPVFPGGNPAP